MIPKPFGPERGRVSKALCGRWRIRELSLFGSQARHDATPGSDVDLLVEYEPTADWSLLDTARLRDDSPSFLAGR
jgi:predicted nucleotidyltransferase